MSAVRVFLEGGAQFDLVASEIKAAKSTLDGSLSRLSWTDAKSGRPLYLKNEAVVAVVVIK